MNLRKSVSALMACLLFSVALAAEEPARLPYEFLYQVQLRQDALSKTYTNLVMSLRLKSSRPEVKTADLQIYIDSKSGPVPVPLDGAGAFSVPMLGSLLNENPSLVCNQPKGTMVFSWYVGLKVREIPTNGVHYRALMQPLKDLENIRNLMVPGLSSPASQALLLEYAPDQTASVVIHAKSGDRVFKTADTPAVAIPWDPALFDEDPAISIPVPPQKLDVADADEK